MAREVVDIVCYDCGAVIGHRHSNGDVESVNRAKVLNNRQIKLWCTTCRKWTIRTRTGWSKAA